MKEVVDKILDLNYLLVGISVYDTNVDFAISLSKYLKQENKDSIIGCGGHFATFNAKHLLKSNVIDYVFKGEGEELLLEFMEKIHNNIELRDIKGFQSIVNLG